MDGWASNKLPERLPFSKKRLPKKVIFSYIFDYAIVIVLIATFTAIDKIPPFHQQFSLQNYTLHYPFATKERVPVPFLLLICVAAPAVIIALYTLVIDGIFSHQKSIPASGRLRRLTGKYRFKDRLWELNCGILGLGVAVGAAFTITGALKNAIGKPRPDLIDRCLIPPETMIAALAREQGTLKLSNSTLCVAQKDSYILQDGFKSFPSGHSSSAFAGLFFLSLYLAAKMHVLDAKGEVWKIFIVMIPTLAAALVAGTRIMDARHHPFDVITGSMLGILCAWVAYRQYFPPVSETWRKGRAYPIRSWGLQPHPPNQVVAMDEDLQPLRSVQDEERGETSGFSTNTTAPPVGDHGGNVFRQQISASQRQRGGESHIGVQHSDTMNSTLSTKVARYQHQLPGANPFTNDPVHQRGRDNYDYSSSEDEDSYELQQTYTVPTSQGRGVYNPVEGTSTDTGYHPPTGITPAASPPTVGTHLPVVSPTGDIAESRTDAPPVAAAHGA